ncbi:BCL2 modifying factor 1 isoform X1 [Tachysurus vachellii]|uniref:BCL2 modifying factor 1 isoform X1 n=1 Tax=Tachysurus vachellii TaxID=175792 RepID=UPI00296AFDDB|nr:BCL2 modifying factor 1 isoform X1 [Tachysurus vachellii]XP_060736215.1 BCL2 modifying factor 1 isoform X1 [Tachysurus vachellii]
MDEDEDDVFGPVSQCWPSSNREDHSTQTPGHSATRLNGMLPCGVAEEPSRLFYGSAGLLLLTPPARSDSVQDAMFPENQPLRRPAHSVEAQIGQKLQIIGDQFYQEHMLINLDSIPWRDSSEIKPCINYSLAVRFNYATVSGDSSIMYTMLRP